MPQVFDFDDSGMRFIRDNAFRIEKSDVHEKVKSNGVKVVEFVRIIDNQLHFVEARKSLRDINKGEKAVKYFNEEIEEIRDKFVHSLNLFASVKICVNEENLPDDFALPKKSLLVFVLVVKEHDIIQCKLANDALVKSLNQVMPRYWMHIWRPIIHVVNYEMAVKQNLIVETTKQQNRKT